ncbi:hypothetical protein GCM10010129_16500 [Streptomyces fumigatiscleroticus]|nr:hypothetical protein GCM10010129_16500 [Streptomyces fumigatiscleroticus]
MSGAALRSDARVWQAVHAIGARHGIDYTDDAAVTALLTERRRALAAMQRGPLVWLGGLALLVGAVWPFVAPTIPSLAGKPVLAYGPAGPLLLLAVAALTAVHVRWKRELTRGALAGYREVLGVARAHGIALTHVPAWLEGRSSGGGKGAAPIPAYPRVEPPVAQWGTASQGYAAPWPGALPQVPPKPAAVEEYERIADAGGWHDETGCLLVLGGAGGAVWAATSDKPLGYAALVLVPLAVLVWLAGSRQGKEKQRLGAEAKAYVRAVSAAQAAGAQVPELSPALRKLLEE